LIEAANIFANIKMGAVAPILPNSEWQLRPLKDLSAEEQALMPSLWSHPFRFSLRAESQRKPWPPL
jgi:hypothetical protein